MIVAIVGALGASALALYFVSPTPLALLMIFVAFVGAGILRAVLFVVHLIPLYSDIVDVINHVQRKGFRLHILRFAVKSISIVSFAIIILGFVLLNAMFTGAAYLMFGSPEYQTMIMFAGLLLSYVVAFHLMFDSWKMAIEELPSELGITGLKQVRKQLGQQRPLDAFKEVLATTDYQPSFSQLLALYGIEALLLLA
jgi:Na+/melibiose symporter-like transporter